MERATGKPSGPLFTLAINFDFHATARGSKNSFS
jgi:hypothetical protein